MLPIDALLPDICSTLQRVPTLVIEAAPGAGKTTRVPPALLALVAGSVIVLEPRRIAARMAARRVAAELGESVGETVGYQVRFEEAISPRTRLRFVTEGILTRRLLTDPQLRGVDAVVLDEFHERHLDSDLALALLKRLQRTRPGLLLIVMSATLDAAPIARYLGNGENACPILRSEGRVFPLTIRHQTHSADPLHVQVRRAAEALLAEGHSGDTLVFLPGAAEIRRTMRECAPLATRANLLVVPLHGDLSTAEQDLAITPQSRQKLILATNVAESSVTVEGVTAVIDSGLARFATYSAWTGIPALTVSRISKASATQRAGRAGRTAPGTVVRLYPHEDFLLRPERDTPEILRSDLAQLCLALRSVPSAVTHSTQAGPQLEWLDAPPEASMQQAEALLDRLGAAGEQARYLARFPVAPRLARMLVEAEKRNRSERGCLAAALLGSGVRSAKADLLEAIESPQEPRVLQQAAQLRRLLRHKQDGSLPVPGGDDALLISVLAGFPDRVARVRAGRQVLLSSGISADLAGESSNPPAYEFMVALEVEDRSDNPLPLVRMAARIEPEWLLDLFPDRVRAEQRLAWNRTAERVEATSALLYDALVLEESQDLRPDMDAVAEMLSSKALDAGLELFVDAIALENLRARAEFAGLPLADTLVAEALRELCIGLRSFADLRRVATKLLPMLEQSLGTQRLQSLAPKSLRLQGGRELRIQYERGKPPWIASRLQDFFGMRTTPRVGPAQTTVVVHLLAPNQRAVQTTTDLAGFWERLYPQVRRELMRRYPRHQWPENP
ncbi:ATP-dependent helicase HrpB [Acidipila sp. EB88]|uniref:ATP-dependent helicase HrpB n=1 Tax=Acidipila sp. EB88 TaxID=2305226 RepID=UPI0026A9CA04